MEFLQQTDYKYEIIENYYSFLQTQVYVWKTIRKNR